MLLRRQPQAWRCPAGAAPPARSPPAPDRPAPGPAARGNVSWAASSCSAAARSVRRSTTVGSSGRSVLVSGVSAAMAAWRPTWTNARGTTSRPPTAGGHWGLLRPGPGRNSPYL
ncbi:hypothetical protein ETD86_00780 [Nonomuraea turkmeniaca]|uniref:Uncharacterized protein n=1 Tax=Nonomuraea turkmeniaca TaxID=103838 RepID=A0A5S4FXL0_9ACTN|nr:hypothetical protein ETD86_00780 [Nonomuraea turkmeniaca]